MTKDTNPQTGKGARGSKAVIVSIAIALMFVMSLPFAFGGNDNDDFDGGIILGADQGEVDISGETSWKDIVALIETELEEYDTVTVIGELHIDEDEDTGDEKVLTIGEGQRVMWNAEYSNADVGMDIEGGAFVAESGSILILAWFCLDDSADAMLDIDLKIIADEGVAVADNDSTLTITGSVTFEGQYSKLKALKGGTIYIGVDVIFESNSSEICIFPDEEDSKSGIVEIGVDVTFKGDCSGITIFGDGDNAGNGALEIGGNLKFGDEGTVIALDGDGIIKVRGDFILEGGDSQVNIFNGTFNIDGNVTALFYPADESLFHIYEEGRITVINDVTTTGALGEFSNSSTVTIGGNVTASGEYGILFLNNEIDSMSMVIINGTFTADDDQYVGFTDDGGNNIFTSKSEYTEISGGYYVYDLFEDAGFDAVLKVKAFIEVTFTAEQTGGSNGTADSTGIVIQFSDAVEGLTIGDITVTDDTGEVTVGTLSGSGAAWTVALTGVAAQGNVTVAVADFDAFVVTTAPQSVAVYKDTRTSVTFTAEQTGGSDGTADSTGIVIQFSDAVEGLTIRNITVTDDTGEVTVGTLTGSGTTWTVALTGVAAQGNVTVSVADFDAFVVTTASQSVAVYKDTTIPGGDGGGDGDGNDDGSNMLIIAVAAVAVIVIALLAYFLVLRKR